MKEHYLIEVIQRQVSYFSMQAENTRYWPKPKWIRWKTFEKKRQKILELEQMYWPMALKQLNIETDCLVEAERYCLL